MSLQMMTTLLIAVLAFGLIGLGVLFVVAKAEGRRTDDANHIVVALLNKIGFGTDAARWSRSPAWPAISERLRDLVIETSGTIERNFFNSARLVLTQRYLLAAFEQTFTRALFDLDGLAITPAPATLRARFFAWLKRQSARWTGNQTIQVRFQVSRLRADAGQLTKILRDTEQRIRSAQC